MTSPSTLANVPNFEALRYKLESAGMTPYDAITIAGTYVLSFVGLQQRVFAYSKDLASVVEKCQSVFQPRFQHQPWTDGEDVVQAGETPGGDIGFNRRFNNIELDLKDLAQEIKEVHACLATLRVEASTLMGEVRNEINRINGDIHRLSGGGTVTPTPFGTLAGAKYLGTAKVLDKDVQLWDTQHGTMMLPLMTTIAAREVDSRVNRVAGLGSVLRTNTALRKRLDTGPITKEELLRDWGDVSTESGSLRSLVGILPDTEEIAGADALLDLVAEREALALRTGPGTEMALASAFGADEKVETVANVSVEKFTPVPLEARAALAAAGIDTMEKLANAEDKQLTAALRKVSTAGPSEAAAWRGAAKTLIRLR